MVSIFFPDEIMHSMNNALLYATTILIQHNNNMHLDANYETVNILSKSWYICQTQFTVNGIQPCPLSRDAKKGGIKINK